MGKYIFLSDIDGTLIGRNCSIPPKVISSAYEFMNAGGLLSLCTGRAPVSARWVAKELGVNMPCILYTGAAIYDFITEQCIWSRHFDDDIMFVLQQLYYKYPDFSILAYTLDKTFAFRINKRLSEHGIKEEIPGFISNFSDIQGNILKLVLVCDDIEKLFQCKKDLFLSAKYNFAFSSTHFAEVVPQDAGKDNALKALSELYNVQPGNFFAAGDGMTDLPMFKLAGYSFAPSSSPKPLLDACDMIIPSYEEGGMEKAFNFARTLMLNNEQENLQF